MKLYDLSLRAFFAKQSFKDCFVAALLAMTLVLISLSGCSSAEELPSGGGEAFRYEIRKLKMKVGNAETIYKGLVDHEGGQAILITVISKGFNFYDAEEIYLDPQTFYPLFISRDLDIFGKKEKIKEYYDRERGKVRIVKEARGRTSEQTIEKKERLENIYGFILRFRLQGNLTPNNKITVNLPTKEVVMIVRGNKELVINGKTYQTTFVESEPAKFKIWFEETPKKIPLKIDGAVGFGKTSMVFVSGSH